MTPGTRLLVQNVAARTEDRLTTLLFRATAAAEQVIHQLRPHRAGSGRLVIPIPGADRLT